MNGDENIGWLDGIRSERNCPQHTSNTSQCDGGADEFRIASFNMERFFDTVDDAGSSDVALTRLIHVTASEPTALVEPPSVTILKTLNPAKPVSREPSRS